MKLPIHLQNAPLTIHNSTILSSIKYVVLALLVIFNFMITGCSKIDEIPESEITTYQISDQPITSILVLDSTIIACEASRNQSGSIYEASFPFDHWQKSAFEKSHPFYTLSHQPYSNSIWAAGDYLTIYKCSTSKPWEYYPLWDHVPTNEFDRPPFRKWLWLNDSCAVAVAGEYYKKGVLYFTNDGGINWSYTFFPNELTAVAIDKSGRGYAAGYGILLKIDVLKQTYELTAERGFYITAMTYSADGKFYYSTWDGEIGTISSNGELNALYSSFYRFNGLISVDGTLYACANDGVLLMGSNDKFRSCILPGEEDLISLTTSSDSSKLYISTELGKILRINLGYLNTR